MKKNLLCVGLIVASLTGCSNVHEFINSDFMNAAAPNVGNFIKTTFYSERYPSDLTPDRIVPKDFSNTMPDNIGQFKFIAFTRLTDDKDQFSANYYKPVSRRGDIAIVDVAMSYRYPMKTKSKKDFQSFVIREEFNCSKETFSYLNAKAYSGKFMDGILVSDKDITDPKLKNVPIEKKPFDQMQLKKVCG